MKRLRLVNVFAGCKLTRLLLVLNVSACLISLNSHAAGKINAVVHIDPGSPPELLQAQVPRLLKGTVLNDNNQPVAGASVLNRTTAGGMATDAEGRFAIEIRSAADSIQVTAVGYEEQVFTAGEKPDIAIILKAADERQRMEEIVVVGYGKQKKESVTAAISTISAKELVQSPVANISNALAGRLSGLTAIQTSGKPGADASALYVRGIGTYTDQTAPLVMVDGVARDSYNEIDPNEIETVSVLKDASATAVYGVRGANGVILITTKRGRQGAPAINASAQTAVSQFIKTPTFVNSYEYAMLQNEKSFQLYWINHAKDADIETWNDFLVKRENNWVKESGLYFKPEELLYYKNAHTPTLSGGEKNPYYNPYFYPDVNWSDLIFKKFAPQSQANVNLTGGTESLKYFISLGYLTQGGLFKTDYMPFADEMDFRKNRYNLRGNFDFDVNKDFRISVDVGTQFVNISGMDNDGYIWEKRILWSSPLSSPGLIDGKFVVPYSNPQTSLNPLYEIANSNNYNLTNNSTLNSSVRLSYKLDFVTRGLSANARGAYDSYFSSRSGGHFSPVYYGISANPNGDVLDPVFSLMKAETPPERWADWYNGKWRKIYGEFSLNYARTFGGKHSVTGLLLYSLEKLFDPGLSYHLPKAYIGTAGRVTYAYKSRYLAEFNMGYNGSENFPEGKRFGFLPAYSLGWVVSNEDFFPKSVWLNYFKIRGSLGKVGNDRIGGARYLYLPDVWNYGGSGYAYNGYTFGTLNSRTSVQGAQEGALGNPNVSWETAAKSNIGFELRLLNNTLSVTYDFFNEDRRDILSYRGTVPAILQATLPPYNLGRVKNWGNEIEVSYTNRMNKFDYWLKGNFSTNHNRIVFMDEAIPEGLQYQAATGRPIGQGLFLQAQGLYTSWDDLYAIDENGDPILAQPVPALNKNGQPYKNAAGNDVYQKDLGYGGVALQPGEVRLTDINEDGVINEKDYIRTGNTTIPRISYGLSFGFSWNGLDLSVLFQGVGGVAKFAMSQRHFNKQESLFDVDLNRFTLERYNNGERVDFPIAAYDHTGADNTFFLKNTSYTRLKNLEIGYTLKPLFLKRIGVGSARIYANGNNLYTWSPNRIWGDPENLAYIGYPLTRTYNMGLNINF